MVRQRYKFTPALIALALYVGSCADLGLEEEEKEKAHEGVDKSASFNSTTFDASLFEPPECKVDKSDTAFANSVTQSLFARDLNEEERAKVEAEGF